MKKSVFYITLCLFTLSSAYCRAERRTVEQNFKTLTDSSKIVYKTSNTIGETDFVTYTCSGGAKFKLDGSSHTQLFVNGEEQMVTTSTIANLDSLCIYYAPDAKKEMTVSIRSGEGKWTEVPVVQRQKGFSTVQMPQAGDYSVRIARGSNDVYIKEIHYIYIDLSECPNCFLYKPE